MDKWCNMLHKSLPATQQTAGWSLTADKAKTGSYSLEYSRCKTFVDGIPRSAPVLPKHMNYNKNDAGSHPTADGLVVNKKQIFDALKATPVIQRRDLMGFHGDGQYREYNIADKMKKKYNLTNFFFFFFLREVDKGNGGFNYIYTTHFTLQTRNILRKIMNTQN